ATVGCDQRWKQEESLAQLYLRLDTWDKDGQEKQSHNFYDVSSTFMLLARGASFARLPSEQEELAIHSAVRARLGDALQRLGGYPERCGICVGATDAVTPGGSDRFRLGTAARAEAQSPAVAAHVLARLPP
ncbi:unnamed protein product, partial [Polarella glacialis]